MGGLIGFDLGFGGWIGSPSGRGTLESVDDNRWNSRHETAEEAWANAELLLQRTSLQTALDSVAGQLPAGETLETYVSDDPQVQRNLQTLREGRLPTARELEIYPNVWVGPSLFGFDILRPAAGTYLVGSASQVAERLREYQAQGVSAFILSGYPLIDEAQRVADLLFPLLELDHGFDIPLLSAR